MCIRDSNSAPPKTRQMAAAGREYQNRRRAERKPPRRLSASAAVTHSSIRFRLFSRQRAMPMPDSPTHAVAGSMTKVTPACARAPMARGITRE